MRLSVWSTDLEMSMFSCWDLTGFRADHDGRADAPITLCDDRGTAISERCFREFFFLIFLEFSGMV